MFELYLANRASVGLEPSGHMFIDEGVMGWSYKRSYALVAVLILLSCGGGKKDLKQDKIRPMMAGATEEKGDAQPLSSLKLDREGEECAAIRGELKRSDCQRGQICVPRSYDSDRGHCLISCGIVEDNDLKKDHGLCLPGKRCMLLRDESSDPLGMFCLEQQQDIDMPCLAPLDHDACADGMACLSTKTTTDKEGERVYGRNRCKRECSIEAPCSNDKTCLYPDHARIERQRSLDGDSFITCDLKLCQDGDEACPCRKDLGFSCRKITDGIGLGVCARDLGICGDEIPLASVDDFLGSSFIGEPCNEINESRICQDFSHDPKSEVSSICRISNSDQDGICIAPCSLPALDKDNDGKIGDEELGKRYACPEGYSCRDDVSRRLGIILFIKDHDKYRPCDPDRCRENQPCPEQCGPGDAECIPTTEDGGRVHACGAPVGTCLAEVTQ